MIFIEATNDTLDKCVKAVCAPLFATGVLLQGGHSEKNINATVTFVEFKSRVYAVTCHHVLSAFASESKRTNTSLIPSIHSGKTIFQFGRRSQKGQRHWSFISCREFPNASMNGNSAALADLERRNRDLPDIAIADLTDHWAIIKDSRQAEAISLDEWTEPEWSKAGTVWLAYGFPNDHKQRAGNQVSAPMPRVRVELASSAPSPDKPTYTLCSTLIDDHGWGFSGLSGGPVLITYSDGERFAYVGITFEGAPSSAEDQAAPDAFVTAKDIVLTGYHLTPDAFQSWLDQRRFAYEF